MQTIVNRREALKRLALGGLLPAVGNFTNLSLALAKTPQKTVEGTVEGTVERTVEGSVERTGRRLVLVELAGANDGLNTLVPFKHDQYHRLRPKLSLDSKDLLMLSDEFAMNKALQPLMQYWHNGDLAWVHGLGYPTPNRSHFKSTAIWETGGDGRLNRRTGWLTHDLEHRMSPPPTDPHGISLVDDIGLFASDSGSWLSLSNPEQLNSVSLRPVPTFAPELPALVAVANRMQSLNASLSSMVDKLQRLDKVRRIPGGDLGQQLRQVVKLIRSGMDTPVYRVRLNGFDTHANQPRRHVRLMQQLGSALTGFAEILLNDGEWNNTVIMTYSEFGRRVAENRSGGTDHGTAAPHLLLGGAVRGGFFGEHPDLNSLIDDDMQFTTDYRALYQEILANWFSIEDNEFQRYASAPLRGLISTEN